MMPLAPVADMTRLDAAYREIEGALIDAPEAIQLLREIVHDLAVVKRLESGTHDVSETTH